MTPVKIKLFQRSFRPMFLLLTAVLMVDVTCEGVGAETAQEIEAGVGACLHRFYNQIKTGREMVAMAEGVLVMPDVLKVGLIVGGEYGDGALRVGGKTVSYYNLVSGSVGFQIGGQAKDIVILFMTDEALKEFQAGNGWEVGVDGNVALVHVGVGERLDLIRMNDPIIGFIFDVKGLMVDISLKGAKFSKMTPE